MKARDSRRGRWLLWTKQKYLTWSLHTPCSVFFGIVLPRRIRTGRITACAVFKSKRHCRTFGSIEYILHHRLPYSFPESLSLDLVPFWTSSSSMHESACFAVYAFVPQLYEAEWFAVHWYKLQDSHRQATNIHLTKQLDAWKQLKYRVRLHE